MRIIPFSTCELPSQWLGEINYRVITVLVFKSPFYLIMTPQCQSGGAGISDVPHESWEVLPSKETVEVLDR